MALGTCRECGGRVSSLARTCPHCGSPQPGKGLGLAGCGLLLLMAGLPVGFAVRACAVAEEPAVTASGAEAPVESGTRVAEAMDPEQVRQEAAVRRLKAAEERRRLQPLLETAYDTAGRVRWYWPKGADDWEERGWTTYAYLGQHGGDAWLRWVMALERPRTTAWEGIVFGVDGDSVALGVDRWDRTGYMGYGRNTVVVDLAVTDALLPRLRRVAAGRKVTLRFGDPGHGMTYGLKERDLEGLRDVLAFYDALDFCGPYAPPGTDRSSRVCRVTYARRKRRAEDI